MELPGRCVSRNNVPQAIMSEVNNPYASPAIEATPRNADQALNKLFAPALGLMIISGFGVAFVLIVVVCAIVALVALIASGADPFKFMTFDPGFVFILIMAPANALIYAGAWNMRSGKRHRFCVMAALLGSLPVTPICLGIPFGIWALIVLHRRDVKEAFAQNAEIQAKISLLINRGPSRQI